MTAARSKARSSTLTKKQREAREKAIVADLKAGKLSYRRIAEKHSVSLPTVNNKAKKFGISRGRRKNARIVVAAPRRQANRTAATRGTARTAAARHQPSANGGFGDALRSLVLEHYPNITLAQFDRLSQAVHNELD